MLHNIAIGILLFILTTAIHTGGMLLTLGRFEALSRIRGSFPHHGRLYLMAMVVISMYIVSITAGARP